MAGCNDDRVVRESVEKELTTGEIIDRLLKPARALGVTQMVFSGGELLLREDAFEILEASARLDYLTGIVTNGSLLTDELILKLKRLLGRKLILVFGLNSVVNNEMNRFSRSTDIETVRTNLERCRKFRVRRHVVVNVAKPNMKDLDSTFGWLAEHRVPFNRTPFAPRMSGRKYFEDWGFSREDMRDYIFPALLKYMQGYFSFTPFFLSPEVHAEVAGGVPPNVTVPQNPSVGCWVGSWFSVGAEGDVSPCPLVLDSLAAGNVREQSLFEIIDGSEIFRTILDRNQLKGKCGRCRYKFTCGGCRILAYYNTGDYMAEDPTCFFEPEDESTRSEHEEQINETFRQYLRLAVRGGMYTLPARVKRT
jgi:radical SAM protein with 4Fe4S-binding SPASM domain